MDVAVALQRKKTIKILSIVDFSLSKQGIFFVLECRGFEQPAPAAAGRKSARWAVCEGAGESRHSDHKPVTKNATGLFLCCIVEK